MPLILREVLKFAKEWVSLVVALLGLFISYKANKLAKESAMQERDNFKNREEKYEKEKNLRELRIISEKAQLKLMENTEKNLSLVEILSEKQTEFLNLLTLKKGIPLFFIYEFTNSFFTKTMTFIDRQIIFQNLLFLMRTNLTESKNLYFECLECKKTYIQTSSKHYEVWIDELQGEIKSKIFRFPDTNKILSAQEYKLLFSPFIEIMVYVLKEWTYNFFTIEIDTKERIRFTLFKCIDCQKYDFTNWCKDKFPQVNLNWEKINKLIEK